MMPVGILARQVVVVGVAPADPAGRAGQQAVVQDLAVVAGGVGSGHEVRADAELLEHDRAAERARQLALPCRRVMLAYFVVAHRVDVRSQEVAEPRRVGEREPGVLPASLGPPRAVAERERLLAARRAHRVPDDLRPGGDDLPRRAAPAVDRHLVGDQPAAHRRVGTEAAHHLAGEPGLPGDHPDVGVEVPPIAPGRVPVLAGHVADDERRHGGHVRLGVPLKEVGKAVSHRIIDAVGLRHEVRPVEERAGHAQAVLPQHGQLTANRVRIVVPPHQRAAGPGPEVGAQPVDRLPGYDDPRGIPVHTGRLPSSSPMLRESTGRSRQDAQITIPVK